MRRLAAIVLAVLGTIVAGVYYAILAIGLSVLPVHRAIVAFAIAYLVVGGVLAMRKP